MHVSAPRDMINQHQDVGTFIDIMHVNRMPFLHTTSEGTKLRKFICMPSLTKRAFKVATQEQIDICKGGGFRIRHADAEMQFKFIKD